MDRAAIFAEIVRRNRLRLDNQLPPLDVRAEYEFEVGLAKERQFREDLPELAARFAADRARIETTVIADLWQQQGAHYRHTKAGQWAINHETRKRFRAFLLAEHGIETPPMTNRHAVVYGAGATAVVIEHATNEAGSDN